MKPYRRYSDVPGNPKHRWLGVGPAMKKDALGFLMNVWQSYGDIAWYSYSGKSNAFLVTHPKEIKYVLADNYANFGKNVAPYKYLKAMMHSSLLTNDGDEWRSERLFVQPYFKYQAIKSYISIIISETLKVIDSWRERTETTISLDKEMINLTSHIMARILFGSRVDPHIEQVYESFYTINETITDISKIPPLRFLLKIPTPSSIRFRSALQTLDTIVFGIVREKMNNPNDHEGLIGSMLAHFENKENPRFEYEPLVNLLKTLYIAGFETTAMALTWTFYHLANNGRVYEKLLDEVDQNLTNALPTEEDLENLKFPRMTFLEALRLSPPAWAINRRTLQDDKIGGYSIAKGDVITICPYLTHRHADYWSNPTEFSPERFQTNTSKEYYEYSFIPFGGGARKCLGQSLATMEGTLIVALISQHFRLEQVPDFQYLPETLITLRPRLGMPMKLVSRRN